MSGETIAGRADWLLRPELQRLLGALSADGEQARIAGGAIRNTLLGEPVADIDIATTTLPDETERRAASAGFRPLPTGKEYGTITVVAGGVAYEVTTLRADIETDGRRAKVAFGRDWKHDAERRDFTINALYAEADGTVIDPVGGLADIESRTLRFIGDAEARIREDYLRILRFFRFFAWYGSGRPDAEGLRACTRLKAGLEGLSVERVWSELRRLLQAPDPSRALLWMRQTGVLGLVLPESEKWGIDAIHPLVATERQLGWPPDPLLRLSAIVPPDPARMETMARRLKLSNAETARLVNRAMAEPADAALSEPVLARRLYSGDPRAVDDRIRLAFAQARGRAGEDAGAIEAAAGFLRQLRFIEGWHRPVFPVGGSDLVELGMKPGKNLGEVLKRLEREWAEGGFGADRGALLSRAAEIVGESDAAR